jgi:hypothetical protein
LFTPIEEVATTWPLALVERIELVRSGSARVPAELTVRKVEVATPAEEEPMAKTVPAA